jgi:hypothetical protein
MLETAGLITGNAPLLRNQSGRHKYSKRLRERSLSRALDPLDQNVLQDLRTEPTRLEETFVSPSLDYVFFRKNLQQVKITNDGAYIPRSLFPPAHQIDYQITRTPDGSVSVNVFSHNNVNDAPTAPTTTFDNRTIEMRWIAEHRDQYVNQWVALEGNRLLSYGDNARDVYLRARELGVSLPFVAKVERRDTGPFGGL